MDFKTERELLILERKRKFGYRLQGFHENNMTTLRERARPTCKKCHGRGYAGINPDKSLWACDCTMNKWGGVRKEKRA